MLPLIVVTGLFSAYIRQEHFRVANHLPLRECSQVDQLQSSEDFGGLFKNVYVQPELQTRMLYPDALQGQSLPRLLLQPRNNNNTNEDDEEMHYLTPNQSEAMTDASLRSDDPLHPRASLAPLASSLDVLRVSGDEPLRAASPSSTASRDRRE
jgi:hypothetical protein